MAIVAFLQRAVCALMHRPHRPSRTPTDGNLAQRRSETTDELARGTRHRVRAVQSAGEGFLTGQIDNKTTFHAADFRNVVPRLSPGSYRSRARRSAIDSRRTSARRRFNSPMATCGTSSAPCHRSKFRGLGIPSTCRRWLGGSHAEVETREKRSEHVTRGPSRLHRSSGNCRGGVNTAQKPWIVPIPGTTQMDGSIARSSSARSPSDRTRDVSSIKQ